MGVHVGNRKFTVKTRVEVELLEDGTLAGSSEDEETATLGPCQRRCENRNEKYLHLAVALSEAPLGSGVRDWKSEAQSEPNR